MFYGLRVNGFGYVTEFVTRGTLPAEIHYKVAERYYVDALNILEECGLNFVFSFTADNFTNVVFHRADPVPLTELEQKRGAVILHDDNCHLFLSLGQMPAPDKVEFIRDKVDLIVEAHAPLNMVRSVSIMRSVIVVEFRERWTKPQAQACVPRIKEAFKVFLDEHMLY